MSRQRDLLGSRCSTRSRRRDRGGRAPSWCTPSRDFYATRGTALAVGRRPIRPVGVGELLARLEHLRRGAGRRGTVRRGPQAPAAVPAAPSSASSAAARRPPRRTSSRTAAVAGPAVALPGRGGRGPGHVRRDRGHRGTATAGRATRRSTSSSSPAAAARCEDLLPFSNEALVRAVAACRTPVVSAIGHEQTLPCSTSSPMSGPRRRPTPPSGSCPTSREELERVGQLRRRTGAAINALLSREQRGLVAVCAAARSSPTRTTCSTPREDEVRRLVERSRRVLSRRLDRAGDNLAHTRARVTALSPAATLDRGYAVLQRPDGQVVRARGGRDRRDAAAGSARRRRARRRGPRRAGSALVSPKVGAVSDDPRPLLRAGPRRARRGRAPARDRVRRPSRSPSRCGSAASSSPPSARSGWTAPGPASTRRPAATARPPPTPAPPAESPEQPVSSRSRCSHRRRGPRGPGSLLGAPGTARVRGSATSSTPTNDASRSGVDATAGFPPGQPEATAARNSAAAASSAEPHRVRWSGPSGGGGSAYSPSAYRTRWFSSASARRSSPRPDSSGSKPARTKRSRNRPASSTSTSPSSSPSRRDDSPMTAAESTRESGRCAGSSVVVDTSSGSPSPRDRSRP